jgi:predicted  nucleic acid-binding Zn-ribbon protein
MPPVAENLITLWAVQRLDSELDTLRGKVTEIPHKIEGLNLTVSDERRQHEEMTRHIMDLKKRYKLIEVDVKENEERINAKSGQLYSAATNEMYKAFIKEIESLRVAKNKLEEQMIEIMEDLEKSEAKVKVLQKEVVSIEGETGERITTLSRELDELKQAVMSREADRKALAEAMDPQMLRVYERIRQSKGGIAVVSIANNRCNGCINPLPPQLILEVGKKTRLHFCEHCGRILVPPDVT